MTAQPVKFFFDSDFDLETNLAPRSEAIPFEHYFDVIRRVREEAYQRGLTDGTKTAEATNDTKFVAHSNTIEAALKSLLDQVDKAIVEHAEQSAELAMTVARVLAPTLVAREPMDEMEALLVECADELKHTPKLILRVNNTLTQAAEDRLPPLIKKVGFDGRLDIFGDEDIAIGDCRIEWVDGGVIRKIGDLDRSVIERVNTYFEARKLLDNQPRNKDQDDG